VSAHEHPEGNSAGGNALRWSTYRQAMVLIARGATARPAVKVALVVGTFLSLVNEGSVIAAGDATLATWIRIAVNYLVPYVVASAGFLAAFRIRAGS